MTTRGNFLEKSVLGVAAVAVSNEVGAECAVSKELNPLFTAYLAPARGQKSA